MRTVRRSERVRFSAGEMFDLVNDVEAYPRFLHWCQGASVDSRSDTEIVATLQIGLSGINKRFTTRNRLERPTRISMELVEGPFKSLRGQWEFEEHGDGSIVRLELNFEVTHTPLDMMFAMVFEEMVRSQVTAFKKRAEAVYGNRT